MYLSSSLVIRALSALSIVAGLACAYPADGSRIALRADNCDDISKYTVDFFKQNACNKPRDGKHCVFYTRGLTDDARRYAKALGPTVMTIWDFMDARFYNNKTDHQNNPLACIFSDDKKRLTYFEHMSEAYAYFCSKIALLMTENADRIPPDGVWARIEFPTLKKTGNAGQVNQINAYDPEGNFQKTIYKRNTAESTETSIDFANAGSFEAAANCGAVAGREDTFDKGGKWPVNW